MAVKSCGSNDVSYSLPIKYGGDEINRSTDPGSRVARNLSASLTSTRASKLCDMSRSGRLPSVGITLADTHGKI